MAEDLSAEEQFDELSKSILKIPDDNQCKPCIVGGKKKYAEKCTGDSKVVGCPRA